MTLLLIPHFFPGSVPRPLQTLAGPPRVSTIAVPGNGGMVADVYRPATAGPHPAMILLLGVNPLPRTDDQVTTLADGIARTGILTVVAESQALLDGHIRPEEVDNLVALFQIVRADRDVDPRHIGFSGFCVGAVLELLAAADPRIADQVDYVNAFSVYAFASDVLVATVTGEISTPSGPQTWTPSLLTRTVFLRHVIDLLPSERDRASLGREFLEATPLTSPEVQALSPEGKQVRTLLMSRSPEEARRNLDNLPSDLTMALERMSPGASITNVRARTFLMHDESDSYLPVQGARKLAAMAPPERTTYTEFRLFEHVVPGRIEDPERFGREIFKLFRHIHDVLLTSWVESSAA